MGNEEQTYTYISFPEVWWGETKATFYEASQIPPEDFEIRAALVFAVSQNLFVVANIIDRGWCIPGGHLLPGETPEEAVRREAYEEAGITLGDLRLLGHFIMRNSSSGINQIVPTYISNVTEFGVVPEGTESRGMRLISLEELPDHYFVWDELMHSVFHYAMKEFISL